jgi:putative transposase
VASLLPYPYPSNRGPDQAGQQHLNKDFFATLEHELLVGDVFQSHRDANPALYEFIEHWYNPERQHSTLGYVSPQQFEQQLRQMARAA